MENEQKTKILVVDDEKANLNILSELLKPFYKVILAKSGEQAIQRASAENPPDLILLDVIMPKVDGYEVCRNLKAAKLTKEIPIIFLTAKTETEEIVRGFELGAVDYITKPFNPTELLVRIRTHLELKTGREIISQQNNEYRELLHILCHDLKNPIGALQSMMELIGQDLSSFEKLQSMIDLSIENALQIIEQIKEMQALTTKEAFVVPTSVNLCQLVEASVGILKHKTEEKRLKIEFEIDENTQVWAESISFVNSVLNNILTNAIKFSFPDSTIVVKAVKDDEHVKLSIKDAGIGMSKELLKNLFDVSKATSRTGTNGESGTGFGMPLVKKFIQSYGGDMEVHSKEKTKGSSDHGTEILLILKNGELVRGNGKSA